MGRKRSEIAIVPFNKNDEFAGGLLPSETLFYSHD